MRESKEYDGYLLLEDGTRFYGRIFGKRRNSEGEVVFNTGMVGYVESLTDPSYRGQILTFTYPLIGNYGVPDFEKGSASFESDSIQVRGCVVADYIEEYSHFDAAMSLGKWLEKNDVPGITGIDTRALTRLLRKRGTMLGQIVVDDSPTEEFQDPNLTDLVGEVSCRVPEVLEPSGMGNGLTVVVVDCGAKRSIVENLRQRGCRVVVVPYDHDFTGLEYDGVMISNGPGDPAVCVKTIENTARALKGERPVAGICLGCQIIALAAGGKTYKLPYGHRGQNQPCRDTESGRCRITSQNHGYAIDEKSLPQDWEVTEKNLNDGTVEAIRHRQRPFFAVQYHPEASPGPTDSLEFFDKFVEAMKDGHA